MIVYETFEIFEIIDAANCALLANIENWAPFSLRIDSAAWWVSNFVSIVLFWKPTVCLGLYYLVPEKFCMVSDAILHEKSYLVIITDQ